jgi:hypothetical protein
MDFISNINDKYEWMNDMNVDNICRIEQEAQDQFDNTSDMDQDATRWPSFNLKVNYIESIEKKSSFFS